jgi:class 3 adenylate cyclase/tetratricopeptide (TPR) repeat protein
VLFADLVGFTSRAERMDVEDVRGMLAPYHSLVRQQLEERGGTVEKFIGDAAMAVFGAPVAHEDDPERALVSALAIRDALALSNERNPDLDLHVRIGINTGEALVSLDARPAAGDWIASGDVVNTASRLQTAAPIDGVVVGEATYWATRDRVEYEELAAVHAKGKAAPVPCWRALRSRSSVGETRRRHDATPLVDRLRERQLLDEAFEAAQRERSVQAVTLVGVPGIGKSRLVRELFHDLDRRPQLIRWREGRSPPYGHGVTFWALGEIVKAEAGLLESHEPESVASKLALSVAAVVDDADEAEWVEGHLRGLVGVETEDTLLGDRKAEAFAAWRRFVERLAEDRATVLVFEDLHWADDALLDFIEYLIAWAEDLRLLVLCTARPELLERRPGWLADSATSRVVSLGPLAADDTQDLFDALLGTTLLPGSARSALLTATAGNPLYAEEFVRMLVDRAILVRRGGAWTLKDTGDLPVPDTVLGIIAARLDALPTEDKAVLQDASVLGKVFWPGALAHVAERGRWAIEETLRRLEQKELIRRRHDPSVTDDLEYSFEHSLIGDVAYRTILRPLRAEKHRRAAEWLSSRPGARRERADTIAHHYLTALENAEASGHVSPELRLAASGAVQAAARRAGSLHSHAAAARLWRKALELCPPDDDRRPRLLLGLGKALALADEPAGETLAAAAGALLACGDLPGAAEAESMSAWLLSLAGKPEEAREHDWRAHELVKDAPPSPGKALILSSVGAHTVFARDRRDEALRLLQDALSLAQSLGLREIEAEALQFIGMARLDAGDERGVEDIERALASSTELNSPVSLSCYGNLADMRRYFGDLAQSAALHREGERAAVAFGIPIQVRRFRAEQAGDLYYSGEWDRALSHVEEYLEAVQTGSPHRGVGEAMIHRGRIRLARGDVRGAVADARAALEFARETAEPFNLFPALAFHAKASEHAPEEREASVVELLEGMARGQPFWGSWALPDLLAALTEDAHVRELRRLVAAATPHTHWYEALAAWIDAEFARAADLYAAIGSGPDEAVARLHAAQQALGAGDAVQARAQFIRARTFFARVGVKIPTREAEMLAPT